MAGHISKDCCSFWRSVWLLSFVLLTPEDSRLGELLFISLPDTEAKPTIPCSQCYYS